MSELAERGDLVVIHNGPEKDDVIGNPNLHYIISSLGLVKPLPNCIKFLETRGHKDVRLQKPEVIIRLYQDDHR